MKTQCWLALAGILTITCVGLSQDGRQSRRGGIAVTGARADSLKGGAVTMLTVKGSRRVSKGRLTAMSVYHALIFHPESRVISVGGGFSNEGPLSTATVTWTVQRNPPDDYKNTEEKELKIRLHVLDKTVSVGSEMFPLSKGNLFVIRLNQIWLPASTQIRADLGEPAERQKVLDSFKSASPGDELIQKLELQPGGAAFSNHIRPAARVQVSR
ncbi:MAG: hypothetical protein ABR568_03860 [Pyrinomonadaceae bacterium]